MKKLSKLKLKEFAVMNDSEMKSIVGGDGEPYNGGELGEVTVYGSGPNKYKESWHFDLPVRCDDALARRAATCRTSDCSQIGQCRHLPFGAIKCGVGLSGQVYPISGY